jgi:hypothetical protein
VTPATALFVRTFRASKLSSGKSHPHPANLKKRKEQKIKALE